MSSAFFRHILAGIDFSDWTSGVLRTAGEFAARYDAALTVVYAETFLPPPYFTQGGLERISAALEDQKAGAKHALSQVVRETLSARAKVETQLIEAAPAEGIGEAVRASGADLVVLGTHGRSGLNRLMMGSVSEKVVRGSDVPVLTVRGADDAASCRLPFRKILCPVNFSEVSYEAFAYAVDLAQRFDCPLVALAIYEGDPRADAAKDLGRKLRDMKPDGVSCAFEPVVRSGDAAEQILRAAREDGIDLIVQGAQHRPLLESTIIGTTSIRVMRHAACPVLTVPKR